MASTVREQPEWENQQQRQKEARGRNAVHSKRRERACTSHAPSPWTGNIPAGKLGCHFRPVGRFGFKGSGAAFDGKKGGRLPSRLDCFAPTVGVSAGWIAERTR